MITPKVSYSIEFTHIYLSELFSHEHRLSVDIMKRVRDRLDGEDASSNLAVLIDDYNSSDVILDVEEFQEQLARLDATPDFLFYESRLAKYADDLLSAITVPRIRRSYSRYIQSKRQLPCSFMIALWYLLRLGEIKLRSYDELQANSQKPFVADRLIGILPERFKGVEEKALKIIGATPFASRLEDIECVFYDSVSESYVTGT